MIRNYSIHKIKTKFRMMKNYCYIIVDNFSKEAAIIDPAWELNKILKNFYDMDINLSTILLTHHHSDHVNLVKPLVKKFNANVYMHTQEVDFYNFRTDNLIPLENSDQIHLGDTIIDCIHTPGHTIGGLCYLLPDCFFTGDTIFIEGCGICNTIGGSAEDMFYSIEKIKNNLDQEVLVYPAHSYGKEPGCKLSYLFENNIYFHLKKDQFITFRMRKKQNNILNFS